MVRWLLAEALRVVRGERDEGVLELRHGKFGYKPGVEVWMYVSTLPVGMRFLPLCHTVLKRPVDSAETPPHFTLPHIKHPIWPRSSRPSVPNSQQGH